MNRFLNMLERVNLQNVSSFFQTESVQIRLDSNSLEEWENEAARLLNERMKKLVSESCCGDAVDVELIPSSGVSKTTATSRTLRGGRILRKKTATKSVRWESHLRMTGWCRK